MTSLTIAAIPRENDTVWKYSSEKIPHLTILYLGNNFSDINLTRITDFVSHVSSTSLRPFGLSVDRRGILGEDEADVLFFKKDYDFKSIEAARNYFLSDTEILKAYNSSDQYPEWTPHLTMGYPETPAKEDDRDYPGFYWVEFDRIALWNDDYFGPEFRLEYKNEEMEIDMAMSETVDNFLEHYGIKGMKWGRRKANPVSDGEVRVTQKKLGTKVSSEGGKRFEADEDAIRVAALKQIAKKSSTDALTTKQLRELVDRMNLEQQYSRLTKAQTSPGQKFVTELLTGVAKQQATKVINDQANQFVSNQTKDRSN